jgi:hypothetical protein
LSSSRRHRLYGLSQSVQKVKESNLPDGSSMLVGDYGRLALF